MNKCKYCDEGHPVLALDEDGVLAYLTGKLSAPMHALDIYWWRCKKYRKVRGKNYYRKIGEKRFEFKERK